MSIPPDSDVTLYFRKSKELPNNPRIGQEYAEKSQVTENEKVAMKIWNVFGNPHHYSQPWWAKNWLKILFIVNIEIRNYSDYQLYNH